MPALSYVSLVVNNHSPSSTPDDSIATSSSLVEGTEYLVLGWGQHRGGGTSDTSDATLLVGPSGSRTVYHRSRNNSPFNPSASLASLANGANTPFGCAFTYTAGSSDQMELHHWTSDGTGESRFNVIAIDIDALTEIYHQEGTNSDAAASTPTSGWETVGSALTQTVAAGDYIIVATCEAFDGGVAAGDEIAIRVTVDSTEQINSRVQQNASTGAADIYGYMFARVVTLTAASHTIAVEGNGTASGGNIDFRRVRIHLIPVDQIEDSDVQQTLDPGHTVSGIASADVCLTTVNPSESRDFLVFAQYQAQQANWAEGFVAVADASVQDGFGAGPIDNGVGTADDLTRVQALELVTGVSSSTSLEIRLNKVAGGGGTNNLFAGEDCPRAANDSAPADISLIAIRLATPAASGGAMEGSASGTSTASGTLTGTGALAGASAGTSTATATASASGGLAGTSAGAATASGTLAGTGALEGTASGTSTATGTLTGIGGGAMQGTAAGTSTVSGTLSGTGALSGSSAGASTTTATLQGIGALIAAAAGVAVVTGTLSGAGALQGTAAGTSTASATLSGGGEPIITGLSMTTITALREAIKTAIVAIDPVEKTGSRYRCVSMKSEVPGTGFRNFFVEFAIPQPATDGIYGTGVECVCEMNVFMAYGDLADSDEDGLIWSDGQEIWVQLLRQVDPTIAGLMSIEHLGWVDEDESPGQRWGAHQYNVRFFARGVLNS